MIKTLAVLLILASGVMLGQTIYVPQGANLLEIVTTQCSADESTTCYLHLPNGYVYSGMAYAEGFEAARANVVVMGKGPGTYHSQTISKGDYIEVGTGSVIRCPVELTTGASGWTFENLSVDVGDALVSAGKCAEGNAIDAYSPYDKTDEPAIEGFTVNNVTVLGRGATSQFHGVKCENVVNCSVTNSSALFSTHGFVGKFGTGFFFSGLWSAGHSDDCMIMKSGTDGFPVVAHMDDIEIEDITCESAEPNDTTGIYLQAANGSMENIDIWNISLLGTQKALVFSGDNPSKGFEMNNVTASDINFISGPYAGGTGEVHDAVLVEGLVGTATINNLHSYGADNCYSVLPPFSRIGSITINDPVCENTYGTEFSTGVGGTTTIHSPVIVHTPATAQPTIKCSVGGGLSGGISLPCELTPGSGLWYNPVVKFSGCVVSPHVKFILTNNAVSGVEIFSSGSGCPGPWIRGEVVAHWDGTDFFNQGAGSETTVVNPTFNGLPYETIGTEATTDGVAPPVVIVP